MTPDPFSADSADRSYLAKGLRTPYSDETMGAVLGEVMGLEYGVELVRREHRDQLISKTRGVNLYEMTNDGRSTFDGLTVRLARSFGTEGLGTHSFSLGATTSRVGIEKSRNLMTVRLAQAIGMNTVADYAQRFGIYDNLPRQLAMSLGAGETTVLKLTAAYAQLVNGGKKITPTLIDRIQDRNGRTVFVHDKRFCDGCWPVQYSGQEMPMLPDLREQIVEPVTAYQMVSILEGVVQRGTGRAIAAIGKPLAGKTGTSNDSYDVWFVGFSPDLAVGVFIGFDEPQSLGDKETGGSVAAPIFRDFMVEALKDKPATPFRVPPGVRMVRVNAATGKPAMPGDAKAILEAFKSTDRMPSEDEDVLEGEGAEGFTFSPLPSEQSFLEQRDGRVLVQDAAAFHPAEESPWIGLSRHARVRVFQREV